MVIKVKQLQKVYRGKIEALKDIDLVIGEGIFGLLGPNGAGKTTILRIMATLLEPTGGEVKIGEYSTTKDKREIRQVLGYLPQSFGLYNELTTFEFLDYLATLHGIKDSIARRKRIYEVLDMVGLRAVAHRKLATLSGGMKQRVGIAQAIQHDPKVIIVDEPTAGLDPEERIRFRNLFSELAQDRTVIISTHIASDIASICSDMAIINSGRIVAHESPEALVKQAQGYIREVVVAPKELDSLKTTHKVISYVNVGDDLRVRMIADDTIGEEVAANLEDAYLFVNAERGAPCSVL